ncbi:branched-chain amino acid ABC transporter permease [Natronocella acetinitrilica]|nr:branched-chain amino acid ABC transporter permease [Natronocella acetinitrilica]
MPEANRATFATVAVLLGLLLLPPVAMALEKPYLITLVNRAVIYALAAMALDLIMGYGRLVSFGHGAFLGLGAYTVGILSTHDMMMDPFIAGWTGSNEALLVWPLAMAVAAAYALFVGVLSLRTSGVYFIMITLAFAQLVYYFFISLSTYGGEDGLSMWARNTLAGVDLGDRVTFYYVCMSLLIVVLWGLSRLVNSRFGRVIQGCRQNEQRMRALGYRPFGYKLTVFVISGALVGLAGALIANHTEFVSPELMHWSRSGMLMVIVLLGGLCSLVGPIYGALILLMLEEVLVAYTPHWQIVLGPILILAVLFFRGGVYGALSGRRGGQHHG